MTDEQNITSTDAENVPAENNDGSNQQVIPDGYMSQKDVDAIMTRTRKEARQRAIDNLLGELGVDNADTLKSIIAEAEKRKQAEMSEAEKAQAEAEKLRSELEAERQRLVQMEQQNRVANRNRTISEALSSAGAAHPNDLIAIADSLNLSLDNAFDDDGKPDQKALDHIVAEFKKQRPGSFASTAPGSPSNSGGYISPPQAELKKTLRQQKRRQLGGL